MQKERIIKYTTVDEQIEKLLSRGLEINDLIYVLLAKSSLNMDITI